MSQKTESNNTRFVQGRPPKTLVNIPELNQAISDLAEHEKSRPDYLKAMHPKAPSCIRRQWEYWRDQHLNLRCALAMARKAEQVTWKIVEGPK